jgi:hypothetical protein
MNWEAGANRFLDGLGLHVGTLAHERAFSHAPPVFRAVAFMASLDAKPIVAMFEKWDREIGGAKAKK